MIKTLAKNGEYLFTLVVPVVVAIGLLDYGFGILFLYREPSLSLTVHLQNLVATTGLFFMLGVALFAALSLVATLAETWLLQQSAEDQEDAEDESQTDGGDVGESQIPQLLDVVVGPPGNSWRATAGVDLGFAASYGIAFAILEPIIVEKTRFVYHVAVVLAVAIGLLLPAVAYRIWVAKKPESAGYRPLLLAALALVLFYTTARPAWRVSPFTLWPYVLCTLTATSLFAVAVADEYGIRDRTWPRRVLAGTTVLFLLAGIWTVATYDADSLTHSALHSRTRLHSPTYRFIQAPLNYDGDRHAAFLGGADCEEFNPDVGFALVETAANDVDDNCIGGDLEAAPDMGSAPDQLDVDTSETDIEHVIFIGIDTLRADYLGREYDGHPLTPNLDEFAASSVTFERAYAPSSHTNETVPSMMSGEYPSNWHQHTLFFGLETTLAELLGRSGFDTAAILSIPFGRERLVRGFDYVDNEVGERNRTKLPITSPEMTRRAIEFLERRDSDKPMFLWVHYFDPHGYYVPHPENPDWLRSKTKADFYAHEVYGTDRSVGRFLDYLDTEGYLENSAVVIFSDHGEGLGRRHLHWHVRSLAEPIIRVPLVIYTPTLEPTRVDTPVSLLDVYPTVAHLLGQNIEEAKAGRSLVPTLRGESLEIEPVFAEMNDAGFPTLWAVVDWPWKLKLDIRHNAYELYDLSQDEHEMRNLIREEPEQFSRLKSRLGTWRDNTYNTALIEYKRDQLEDRPPWKPSYVSGDIGKVEGP
jgi:arylsulfatase